MVLYGTLWYGMGAYYRWLFSTDGCFAPICRKGGPYAYCTPEPELNILLLSFTMSSQLWVYSVLASVILKQSRFLQENFLLPVSTFSSKRLFGYM